MLVYKSKWVTDNLSSPEYNISRHSNPISMHTKNSSNMNVLCKHWLKDLKTVRVIWYLQYKDRNACITIVPMNPSF